MKITTTHRLFFILVCFSFLSKAAFSQEISIDSLKSKMLDSVANSSQPDQSISEFSRSLDSLTKFTIVVKKRLDSIPNLSEDSLIDLKNELINAQEKASTLGKQIKNHQTVETDSLGLINGINEVYFKIGSLKGRVDERIRKLENLTIKKKAGYIWTAPILVKPNDLWTTLKSEIKNPVKTFIELKDSEWSGLFLLLLLSIGYFYWVFKNEQTSLHNNVKNKLPIAQSILFFLNLAPIFDRQTSYFYIGFILLLILLISFLNFRNYVKIESRLWWLSLISIYVLVFLFNYVLMSNAFIIRTIAIGLNLLALYFGFKTVKLVKRIDTYPRIYQSLFVFFVILNVFAILLNVIGQINVSKSFSITAVGGLVQLVGLIVFGKIILENFNKQFERIKKSKSLLVNLNQTNALLFLRKALFFIGSILWLMVFMINLNIVEPTMEFLGITLSKPHTFGSTSFTLGNIIVCIIIISIANWFQKNLDILLTTSNSKKFDAKVDQTGTKITLLRLAVIILGFLFGVTALGISMNKLTVILGALSVGIGLGMQTIFNNFVSGVILIFEKPFKIGDFIELADKKGRVQKIGIRSSTLLTEQGSEVIIPNGDLLSGRLVNWTHSKSHYRVELSLKFTPTSNLEEVKRIISEEIDKNEYTIKERSVEILYNSISATNLELVVKCWIVNIYKESQFKSSLLESLRTQFTENEIVSFG